MSVRSEGRVLRLAAPLALLWAGCSLPDRQFDDAAFLAASQGAPLGVGGGGGDVVGPGPMGTGGKASGGAGAGTGGHEGIGGAPAGSSGSAGTSVGHGGSSGSLGGTGGTGASGTGGVGTGGVGTGGASGEGGAGAGAGGTGMGGAGAGGSDMGGAAGSGGDGMAGDSGNGGAGGDSGGTGGAGASGGSAGTGGGAPVCPHDVCTAGAALDMACTSCTASVCAALPACCSGMWDASCITQASISCDMCNPVCLAGTTSTPCPMGEACTLPDSAKPQVICSKANAAGSDLGAPCSNNNGCLSGFCDSFAKTCAVYCGKQTDCATSGPNLLCVEGIYLTAPMYPPQECQQVCTKNSDCPPNAGGTKTCFEHRNTIDDVVSFTCDWLNPALTGGVPVKTFGDVLAPTDNCDTAVGIPSTKMSGAFYCSQVCVADADCSGVLPKCITFSAQNPSKKGSTNIKACSD